MIKVQPRAAIPDELIDTITQVSIQWLKDMQATISFYNDMQKKYYLGRLRPVIGRLALLARKDPHAIDQTKTVLRGLPYTEYGIKERETLVFDNSIGKRVNLKFFYGLTKDVIIPFNNQNWNMGPYQVYFPIDFTSKFKDNWQFIPDRDPSVASPHPHHHAGHTCWGGFGGIIKNLCLEADVVEIYRVIYIYLCRYDNRSVLTRHLEANNYPFAKVIA